MASRRGLVRDLAGEQHDAVVARHRDVRLVAEPAVRFARDPAFDGGIVELGARRAAVGGDQRHAGGAGRDQWQAARQLRREREHGGPDRQGPRFIVTSSSHASSPSNVRSIASHRQWMTSRCTSWMRAVRSWGTQMWTSSSPRSSPMRPPPRARQGDDDHLALARGVDRRDDVAGVAATSRSPAARRPCARAPAPALRTPARNVVVGDRGQDRAVGGERDRRQLRALALEAADHFRREVLRVGGRAAVAAGEHPAVGEQARGDDAGCTRDRGREQRRGVLLQACARGEVREDAGSIMRV